MSHPFPFEKCKHIQSGTEIVDYFLVNEISKHPFFEHNDRFNPGYVKLILENGRDLDITGFLARTISMTGNVAVRCALVPQLYDELGAGDVSKLHIFHIKSLLDAIAPYTVFQKEEDKVALEGAYIELSAVYQKLFFSNSFNTCIGVAIANELVVQPIFEYIKENILSHRDKFSEGEIIWVTAHDELEGDHVNDTRKLAGLISQDPMDLMEVFDSGYELMEGIWKFFNVLDKIELRSHAK